MIPMSEEERSAIQRGVETWLSNHGMEPTRKQRCIFTRRWESIRVTRDSDVIDRYSVGPPRPERSVGRHVHSFESPNSCPEPCKPVSGKAGPVRSDDVCHDVLCRDRCRESPTRYCPAPHG